MTASQFPKVLYLEQVMRDGLQIEDPNISVDDKLALLEAISDTGLKYIEVGAFVSPKWTPQMACLDELLSRFTPTPGVVYTGHVLNQKGFERASKFPWLITTGGSGMGQIPRTKSSLCDVFEKRNTNEGRLEEMARWPGIVARAKSAGAQEAGIGFNAGWGSNFVGEFGLEYQMEALDAQYRLWTEAGIRVTEVRLSDESSFGIPTKLAATLRAIKERWPDFHYFELHLHNARGLALTNLFAAILALGPEDTVRLEGSLGGIGGCPYCGNGRATGMAPTEDVIHMLEGMGIPTGVDMDKLVDCVWMLEKMIGRPAFGHVSKAGPRPLAKDQLYPLDLPFIEGLEEAKHFKLGPKAYEGCFSPWKEPIRSYQRPEG